MAFRRSTAPAPAPAPAVARKASSSSRSESKVNTAAIEALFDKFKVVTEDGEEIDTDGLLRFAEAIGIDAGTDVEILLVAWRFGAKRNGAFSKAEFCNGLAAMQVDSLEKLKAALPGLKADTYASPDKFREFYKFVFQVSRDGTEKTLDRDSVAFLLKLVMPNRPHVARFLQFLGQCSTMRITMDQWSLLLDFVQSVAEDLSNFDEDGAWPVLIDEYVEWVRNGPAKKK